ncbi:WhiB family transcriptional regulator [Streptomyces sp. NBC_00554]|uniref:WhiB family transcriptional regulator n=1 Tax=Streptomyces sp. NBC_00554 TaxID=2903661 RepID=UPI00352EBDFD
MINRHRPLLAHWDWQMRALCRGMDSALFFSPHAERGIEKQAREEKAREICRRCSVIEACAWTALSSREPYGVWGGLSENERRTLQQAPGRGPVTEKAPGRSRSGGDRPQSLRTLPRAPLPGRSEGRRDAVDDAEQVEGRGE